MNTINIGMRFGNYEIIGFGEKDDNGNPTYSIRCTKCGFIYRNRSWSSVKYFASKNEPCNRHGGQLNDRTGEIIDNEYIILKYRGKNKYNERLYDIKCLKCGYTYYEARVADIRRRIKSKVGCNHSVQKAGYRTWKVKRIGKIYGNMIRRCHDPKSINYKDYGGAGIYVCDEWLGDHTAFENWMLDNGYQDTWEIDRIDHTKGYCPENCRLVPPGYNSKFNKSNCVNYIIDGELVTGPDIARRLGLRNRQYFSIIYNKHGKEYTQKIMEGMLNGTIPLPDKDYHIELYGKEYNVAELARLLELEYMPLYHKMHTWPEKKFGFYIKQRYKEIQFNKEKQEYLNRKVKSCTDLD